MRRLISAVKFSILLGYLHKSYINPDNNPDLLQSSEDQPHETYPCSDL